MADNSQKKSFSGSLKGAWNKFVGGVGQTYDKTVQKAEDTLESNRIRNRLRELERLNTELYAKIGTEVYRSAEPQISRADFAAQIEQNEKNYAEQQELLLRQALLKTEPADPPLEASQDAGEEENPPEQPD